MSDLKDFRLVEENRAFASKNLVNSGYKERDELESTVLIETGSEPI